MFTFKKVTSKIALLGVAGLTAFSISCSEDSEDETPPVEPDQTVVVPFAGTLGGQSNSDVGSFLDIEANKVYFSDSAKIYQNNIDLIFDGTNLKTPTGCAGGSGFCKTQMTGSTSPALLWDVTSCKTSSSLESKTIQEVYAWWAAGVGCSGLEGTGLNTLEATVGGFYILGPTSEVNNFAIAKVTAVSASAITLSISYY